MNTFTFVPRVLVATMLCGLCACLGPPVKSPVPLVQVGDAVITDHDLNLFMQSAPPAARARFAGPGGRKQVADMLVDRALLFREGTRASLDADPVIAKQIIAARQSIVADAFLRRKLDEKARAYYDAHPEEFTTVELSQILLKVGAAPAQESGKPTAKTATPAAAKKEAAAQANAATTPDDAALQLANELKTRLANGEAFPALAKQYSDDAISKENGGKLGQVWRREPRLMRRGMEAVLDLAFTLAPGAVGGPIKTESGYHLVLVGSAPTPRPYDAVKEQLTFRVQSEVRRDVTQALRKDAYIKWLDPTLANPPTPPVPLDGAPRAQVPPPNDPHTHPHEAPVLPPAPPAVMP